MACPKMNGIPSLLQVSSHRFAAPLQSARLSRMAMLRSTKTLPAQRGFSTESFYKYPIVLKTIGSTQSYIIEKPLEQDAFFTMKVLVEHLTTGRYILYKLMNKNESTQLEIHFDDEIYKDIQAFIDGCKNIPIKGKFPEKPIEELLDLIFLFKDLLLLKDLLKDDEITITTKDRTRIESHTKHINPEANLPVNVHLPPFG